MRAWKTREDSNTYYKHIPAISPPQITPITLPSRYITNHTNLTIITNHTNHTKIKDHTNHTNHNASQIIPITLPSQITLTSPNTLPSQITPIKLPSQITPITQSYVHIAHTERQLRAHVHTHTHTHTMDEVDLWGHRC